MLFAAPTGLRLQFRTSSVFGHPQGAVAVCSHNSNTMNSNNNNKAITTATDCDSRQKQITTTSKATPTATTTCKEIDWRQQQQQQQQSWRRVPVNLVSFVLEWIYENCFGGRYFLDETDDEGQTDESKSETFQHKGKRKHSSYYYKYKSNNYKYKKNNYKSHPDRISLAAVAIWAFLIRKYLVSTVLSTICITHASNHTHCCCRSRLHCI